MKSLMRILGCASALAASGCGSDTTAPATYTLTVSPPTVSLALLGTQPVSATVTRVLGSTSIVDNTSQVSWASSDPTVATVTPSGTSATITGVGHGTATITATASTSGSAQPATIAVTVTAPQCLISSSNPLLTAGSTSGTLGPTDCRDNRNAGKPADMYRVVATADQLLTIDVTSTAFAPEIRLFDATGNQVEIATGTAGRIQHAIPSGSTYTLMVATSGGTSGGAYTLSTTQSALTSCVTYQTTATAITLPANINSTLLASDCRLTTSLVAARFYKFTLASTQVVTASLASTAFPPRLEFFNSADQFVARATDSSVANTVKYSAALTAGTYYARITGNNVSNPLGAFNFTISAANLPNLVPCTTTNFAATITPTTAGVTTSGSLSTFDCQLPDGSYYAKMYRLTVPTNMTVQIDMTSTSFDTFLYLFSSTFGQLDANDDVSTSSTNSRITRALTAGTYFIGANSLLLGATGAFTLVVKQN